MPLLHDIYLNPTKTKHTESTESGISHAAEDLSTVVESLYVQDYRIDESNSTYHAIPAPVAHISGTGINLDEGYDKPTHAAIVREWEGLVALWALQRVYSSTGVDLKLRKINLRKGDLCQAMVAAALDNLRDFEVTGDDVLMSVYLLEQKNPLGDFYTPFAVYHPAFFLCPFPQYSERLFAGKIPWYDASEPKNRRWKDITETLSTFALERLALWLSNNPVSHSAYRSLRNKVYEKLNYGDSPEHQLEALRHKYRAYEFTCSGHSTAPASMKPFYKVLTILPNEIELPPLFTERIVLANNFQSEEKRESGITHPNAVIMLHDLAKQQDMEIEFPAADPYFQRFDILLPVNNKAADVLHKYPWAAPAQPEQADQPGRPRLQLSQVRYAFVRDTVRVFVEEGDEESTDQVDAIESILVSVDLEIRSAYANSKDELFEETQVYTFSHIYYGEEISVANLPYVSVWPWVSLPQEVWKRYYAMVTENAGADLRGIYRIQGGFAVEIRDPDEIIRADVPRISGFACRNLVPIGEESSEWNIYTGSQPFPYVRLYFEAEGKPRDAGIIELGWQPPLGPKARDRAYLGFDLGTTSTVCSISMLTTGQQVQEVKPEVLEFHDYAHTVTAARARQKMEVSKLIWLPTSPMGEGGPVWSGKIFTVSQLFVKADGENLPDIEYYPYINGRLCAMDSERLSEFGIKGPLEDQNIFSDLKLNEARQGNSERALSVFMLNLTVLASLEAFSRGATRITYRFSVPSNGPLRRMLVAKWNGDVFGQYLSHFLRTPPDGEEALHLTEARAAMSHFDSPADRYVLVDIGGGTTDVSLHVKGQPDQQEISFPYAGRQLMVNSILTYLRRYAGEDLADQFSKIWGGQLSDSANGLREQFRENLEEAYRQPKAKEALKELLNNGLVRECVEILLAEQGVNQFLKLSDVALLRDIIRTKYYLLFYLVAQFIKQNGLHFQQGEQRELTIYLLGTGAKGMEIVAGAQLIDSSGMDCEELRLIKQMICDVLNEGLDEADKQELAITFEMRPDVQEKKEVALGLLQPADEQMEKNHSIDYNDEPEEYRAKVAEATGLADQYKAMTVKIDEYRAFQKQFHETNKKYLNNRSLSKTTSFIDGIGSGAELMDYDRLTGDGYKRMVQNAVDHCAESMALHKEYIDTMMRVLIAEELINDNLASAQLKEHR